MAPAGTGCEVIIVFTDWWLLFPSFFKKSTADDAGAELSKIPPL